MELDIIEGVLTLLGAYGSGITGAALVGVAAKVGWDILKKRKARKAEKEAAK